jgi:Concanavalin A-like lectin/glucanases superfamily/Domain of unknown function (DUF2341)
MVLSIFRLRVALLGSLLAMVFCSKDYDPFADLTNARAHVLSCTFARSDTVGLYSTETIVIAVSGRDNVDSFSLHSAHNRFWQDTTVRRESAGEIIPPTTFSFDVSFFDTGVQTVSVTTWRRSIGESVTQDLPVRVTSPLRQADVTSFFGDSTLLCTPPVSDRDVLYEWDFEGVATKSPRDSVMAVLPGEGSATGFLRVTDLAGNHATPLFSFSYSLFDTSRPIILCANTNIRDDTVVTSDSVLAFKAYIADYRGLSVDTCWINHAAFDITYPRTNMYIKLFRNMSVYTRQAGAIRITVDALGLTGKPSGRTFWALFDPSGVSSPGAEISFVVPSKDSSTVGTRDFKIYGTANNFVGDSMTLRVKVNDSLYAGTCVVTGSVGIWTWPVHLGSYVNSISVSAYGPASGGAQPLASAHVVVAYDPTAQDMIKPLIWDISMVGDSLRKMMTPQDSAVLVVTAFDEWSGIQTLTINNVAAQPDPSGYTWRQTVSGLVHGANTVLVKAVDRSQNEKDTAIVVFKNTAPTLVSGPSFPGSVCVDSTYTFRISTFDADNDPVTVNASAPPAGMVVSNDGAISWTPTSADIGVDTLAVRLSDGIQFSGPYTWTVACVRCTSPVAAGIRFKTRESVFPTVLQAGLDTLRVALQIDTTGAGGAALTYSAKFLDRNEVVPFSNTSVVLIWAPALADTGYRTLLVTVGSGAQVFDSITPSFSVVPKNQYPCSLSYSFTGDTTSAGQLDLFTRPAPETLFFAIVDRDNFLTEKYTVTIAQRAVNSIETLNKRDFFIAISPDSTRVVDTIRVHVSDMTGTADSKTFIVRYSAPNPYPLWQHSKSLVLNTTQAGADVAGNVLNFPVLVRLTNINSSYGNFDFSQALPNGQDIRFAKFNGDTCSYQIERWDPSEQGGAEIWVKVDTVYGNNATQSIRMYWGNPAAAAASNGAGVFDTANGFQAVWHMGGAGTAQVTDATGNHYNGTPTALATGAATAGMIGQCQSFNGASSYVVMPNTANSKLNFPVQGTYSVSAWVNTAVLDAQYHTIASKGDNQYSLQIMNIVNEWEFSECMASGGWTTVTSPASVGAWSFVTGVRNGANEYLYVNGTCTDSVILVVANAVVQSTTDNFTIGRQPVNATYFFNGLIDEVRVSSTALSADWIKLCYMNQKQLDALVVFR